MQVSLPSAERIERALDEVYARPEFAPAEGERLMDRFWAFVGRLIEPVVDFFRGLDAPEGTGTVLFWVVVAVVVVVAVAIIAYLVYATVSAVEGGPRRGRRGPREPGEAEPRPRSAADWEAAARRAAEEGRLRDAALALYQALLLRLDARGAVRFDPAKTPGEYRREARPRPDDARLLGNFLRLFEPVAFGGRPLDAAGYERLRAATREAPADA